MASAIRQHRTQFSEEEYLYLEERSLERNEFFNGEIFAMAGGSFNHSTISNNIITQLVVGLRGSSCRTFNNDVKVRIPSNGLFTYPDASVLCGEIEPYQNRSDIYFNPTRIVEVLSPSTMAYDRGEKFELYRELASLYEYVLIWQDQVLMETRVRQKTGQWISSRFTHEDVNLPLASLDLQIPIAGLYENVDWFEQ